MLPILKVPARLPKIGVLYVLLIICITVGFVKSLICTHFVMKEAGYVVSLLFFFRKFIALVDVVMLSKNKKF